MFVCVCLCGWVSVPNTNLCVCSPVFSLSLVMSSCLQVAVCVFVINCAPTSRALFHVSGVLFLNTIFQTSARAKPGGPEDSDVPLKYEPQPQNDSTYVSKAKYKASILQKGVLASKAKDCLTICRVRVMRNGTSAPTCQPQDPQTKSATLAPFDNEQRDPVTNSP